MTKYRNGLSRNGPQRTPAAVPCVRRDALRHFAIPSDHKIEEVLIGQLIWPTKPTKVGQFLMAGDRFFLANSVGQQSILWYRSSASRYGTWQSWLDPPNKLGSWLPFLFSFYQQTRSSNHRLTAQNSGDRNRPTSPEIETAWPTKSVGRHKIGRYFGAHDRLSIGRRRRTIWSIYRSFAPR